MQEVYKILDPVGEEGTRFHFLFDEAFRADNTQYSYGGFHRKQAEDLLQINRTQDLGINFKFKALDVILHFVKSFGPGYRKIK